MLGSASSISCTNTVLNTVVAEELKQFADALEKSKNFEEDLHLLIKDVIAKHKRIIFNGDGYDESWVKEAERRGLLNLKTTPDALKHLLDKKNIDLFVSHGVYSKTELEARHEVLLENYCKIINIEALTMIDMVRKDILPAMSELTKELAEAVDEKTDACEDVDCTYEKDCIKNISMLMGSSYRTVKKTESDLCASKSIKTNEELADFYKTTILGDLCMLRVSVDEMETIASSKKWPYPSYGDILFG